MLRKGLWFFVCLCIVAALWNGFGGDPKRIYGDLKTQSSHLKNFVEGLVRDAGGTPGDGTNTETDPHKSGVKPSKAGDAQVRTRAKSSTRVGSDGKPSGGKG